MQSVVDDSSSGAWCVDNDFAFVLVESLIVKVLEHSVEMQNKFMLLKFQMNQDK